MESVEECASVTGPAHLTSEQSFDKELQEVIQKYDLQNEEQTIVANGQYYDAVLLFDDNDRVAANADFNILLSDDKLKLADGYHPKILRRFESVNMKNESNSCFITWLEEALKRSTFALVYVSECFCKSDFKDIIKTELLHRSLELPATPYSKGGNKFNIIPVWPRDACGLKEMPFNQRGFQLAEYEDPALKDDFRAIFRNTFNPRIQRRKLKEIEYIRSLDNKYSVSETETDRQIDVLLQGAPSPPTSLPAHAIYRSQPSISVRVQQECSTNTMMIDDPSIRDLP